MSQVTPFEIAVSFPRAIPCPKTYIGLVAGYFSFFFREPPKGIAGPDGFDMRLVDNRE
jgi:hypothetical protein